MKEKSNYITPLLRPVTLRQPLLETVSGNPQEGDLNDPTSLRRLNYYEDDEDDYYQSNNY